MEEAGEYFGVKSEIAISRLHSLDDVTEPTPGSEIEACRKEDMHKKEKYANIIGMAGETLYQRYGALLNRSVKPNKRFDVDAYSNTKKRIIGTIIKMPVIILIGRSRVFCSRPPQKNTVLPEKYS